MCLGHGKSIYRLRAVPQNGHTSKEINWRERKKKKQRSPSWPFRSLQSCWAKGNDVGLNDVSFLRDNSVFKPSDLYFRGQVYKERIFFFSFLSCMYAGGFVVVNAHWSTTPESSWATAENWWVGITFGTTSCLLFHVQPHGVYWFKRCKGKIYLTTANQDAISFHWYLRHSEV